MLKSDTECILSLQGRHCFYEFVEFQNTVADVQPLLPAFPNAAVVAPTPIDTTPVAAVTRMLPATCVLLSITMKVVVTLLDGLYLSGKTVVRVATPPAAPAAVETADRFMLIIVLKRVRRTLTAGATPNAPPAVPAVSATKVSS